MARKIRVVVYGSAQFMGEINKTINRAAGLEGILVDPHSPTARHDMRETQPRVIVFDLSEPSSQLYIQLLKNSPGLLLLGVEAAGRQLIALSDHPADAPLLSLLMNALAPEVQPPGPVAPAVQAADTR